MQDPSGETPDQIAVKVAQDLDLTLVQQVISRCPQLAMNRHEVMHAGCRLTDGKERTQELVDGVNAELKRLKDEGRLDVLVWIKLEARKDGTTGFILCT